MKDSGNLQPVICRVKPFICRVILWGSGLPRAQFSVNYWYWHLYYRITCTRLQLTIPAFSFTQVQYSAYASVGGIGSVIKLMFAGLLFLMLVKFNFGRKLLIKVGLFQIYIEVWYSYLLFLKLTMGVPFSVSWVFLRRIFYKGRANTKTGN